MNFLHTQEPNPHKSRMRELLAAHPEVRGLMGNYPKSAFYIFTVVALQTAVAAALSLTHQPWWAILLVAYTLGAVANHAMWVMIHEASHNLIFKTTAANQVMAIIANFVMVVPSAISFKKYHLYHHRYQGELARDADLTWAFEGRMVKNSMWRKALYLALFSFVQGVLRPLRIIEVKPVCRWVVLNWVVEIAYLAALTYFAGWAAPLYLLASLVFAVGLHPVGARWVQEHYVFRKGQETYSYYGPFNKVSFNVGYHNEHHDVATAAWVNLPKIRAAAPEFYNDLHYHESYWKLLGQYLTSKEVSPFSRYTRDLT